MVMLMIVTSDDFDADDDIDGDGVCGDIDNCRWCMIMIKWIQMVIRG